MHQAADALTTLASGIADSQSRIEWCRQQIDDLDLPAGDIPEDVLPQVQNIKNDADGKGRARPSTATCAPPATASRS